MHSCDACFFRLCRRRVSKTCTQYLWLVGWFWFIILIAIIGLPYCRVSCTSYVYFMCICASNPTAHSAGSFDSTLWIITFTLGRLVLLPMVYHQIEPCCLLCLAGGLSARFHLILACCIEIRAEGKKLSRGGNQLFLQPPTDTIPLAGNAPPAAFLETTLIWCLQSCR